MSIVFTSHVTAWHRLKVQQLPTHKFVNLSCGVNIFRTDPPGHGKPIQQLTMATKPPHHLINYIHMHLIKH